MHTGQILKGTYGTKNIQVIDFSHNKKKLEFLLKSNLDFKEKIINDSRHTWHSFAAKFPPQLPKFFIENLTCENDAILDPMMGSCTTLIEASLLNREIYGFDIDPLTLIVGKAKFQSFDPLLAELLGNQILEKAQDKLINNKSQLEKDLLRKYDLETLKFIEYWFLKSTQLELLALIQEIEQLADEKYQQFFKLIFSAIIITKSGGVSLALDLAHTRPHKDEDKKPNSAFVEFSKKLKRNLQNYNRNLCQNDFIKEANAKNLPLGSESVDLIVTSPPYANNAIDYMRAHKFSLVWFGYKISDLKLLRKKYIGSETLLNNSLLKLPSFSEEIVNQLKAINEKKGIALHRYYSEMTEVLTEMFRVLKHQRASIIIVATSIINGLNVVTQNCLAEIGQNIGFEIVHIGVRNINRDKRMLPTGRENNHTQIETRMHNEYIIGFWKP